MARQTKSELKLTEAADKATALLQNLQSRLNRDPASQPLPPSEESTEELDRRLQEYFRAEPGGSIPDQIRDRVIDAVADRILENWERGARHKLGELENQVIDRVAERILQRMSQR